MSILANLFDKMRPGGQEADGDGDLQRMPKASPSASAAKAAPITPELAEWLMDQGTKSVSLIPGQRDR